MIEKICARLEEEANNVITNIFASEEDDHIGIENNAKSDAFERAIEIVQEVAKEYGNGWIPVEDAMPPMPEENPLFENKPLELYLVTLKGQIYPFRAFWNGKFFTDGWGKVKAIAWMPLPPVYQKGE